MIRALKALFSSIVYTTTKESYEYCFQNVIQTLFILLGQYAICEFHTFNGRLDCVAETKKYVYIFEFERDKSAEDALKQIEDMNYALPYAADKRVLYKVGINFNSATKMIAGWKVVSE